MPGKRRELVMGDKAVVGDSQIRRRDIRTGQIYVWRGVQCGGMCVARWLVADEVVRRGDPRNGLVRAGGYGHWMVGLPDGGNGRLLCMALKGGWHGCVHQQREKSRGRTRRPRNDGRAGWGMDRPAGVKECEDRAAHQCANCADFLNLRA